MVAMANDIAQTVALGVGRAICRYLSQRRDVLLE